MPRRLSHCLCVSCFVQNTQELHKSYTSATQVLHKCDTKEGVNVHFWRKAETKGSLVNAGCACAPAQVR
jgi:hypothetical protein